MTYRNDHTTINISRENWRRLHRLKELGDSMDDVVTRLLDSHQNVLVDVEELVPA